MCDRILNMPLHNNESKYWDKAVLLTENRNFLEIIRKQR